MDKIACRLGFLLSVLFTLTIFASALALASEQDNEDTAHSTEANVSASPQAEKAETENPGFWGSVGNFFVDGYDYVSGGVGSFASSAAAWISGQSGDEAVTSVAESAAPETELTATPVPSPSPSAKSSAVSTLPPNTLRYYLGSAVNTGKDNGYSGSRAIALHDPHFGWTLGRFSVSGYTRVTEDTDGDPVFLKTLGDKVALWFTLEQDIDNLNGNDKLIISQDKNGYDEYYGISKTNFGRGTLIIRHIDYQNSPQEPTVYTDYLSAKVAVGADTEVKLFEEGDYEVTLNYEIKSTWQKVFGQNVVETYTNYRIFFRFSVRNGNCMVYPFDAATKDELANTAITESGFYLDLAKSRYLDINVKKEVLAEGANGLIEDTRFNRPAKDGDQYTEEGVYTITVSNRYTGQQTTKQIYVGTNDILKAYVATGLSIDEIEEQLANGAQVSDGGVIVPLSSESISPLLSDEDSQAVSVEAMAAYTGSEAERRNSDSHVWVWPIAGVLALICIALIVGISKRSSLGNENGGVQGTDVQQEEEKK